MRDWSQKKILIADDCKENFRLYSFYLRQTSVQIVFVENGQEALDKFFKEDFDIFILDLEMPIMNGIEALQQIKKENEKEIVIALTAYEDTSFKDKEMTYQFDRYLKKPIDSQSLIECLEQYL